MDFNEETAASQDGASTSDTETATQPEDRKTGVPRSESRVDRLKKKLRKLQGKSPDIYPMW